MTARKSVMDVTQGPVLKKMLLFALPFAATGLLQVCFNAADIIVVGRYGTEGAIGAVGATASFIHLLVNFFMGLSVGVTVAVSQAIGARREDLASRHVHNALATALLSGMIILVVGQIFSPTVLRLMKTPAAELEAATLYLRIYFLGSPAFLIYNFGAALIRTSGDTRRPLIYLSIAGASNFILNLFFLLVLKWRRTLALSVAGVAVATVISHYISAILIVWCLFRSQNFLKPKLKSIRIYGAELRRILLLGIPAGIQTSLFSFSNLLIQSNINAFGSAALSGNTAAVSVESFPMTALDAFGQTAVTFIGQNQGANKPERYRRILFTALFLGMVTAIGLTCIFYPLAPALLGFYIPEGGNALTFALARSLLMMPTFFIAAFMNVTSGSLRGLGKTFFAMLTSVLGVCGFRLLWLYTVYPASCRGADIYALPDAFYNIKVLYASYPFSWAVTALMQIALFFFFAHREKKRKRLAALDPSLPLS